MAEPEAPQPRRHDHSRLGEHWHPKELAQSARLGTLVTAGIVVYVALDAIAQALHPGQRLLRDPESDLALGAFGWVMTVNFVVRGLLSLALVAGLQKALVPAARSQVGAILVELWAVGAFLLAIFPTDAPGRHTIHGLIHLVVALLAFFCGAAGELLLSLRMAADTRWRHVRRPLATVAVFALAMLVVVLLAGERMVAAGPAPSAFGLVERVFLALVLLWMAVVAARLAQVGGAQPSEPAGD